MRVNTALPGSPIDKPMAPDVIIARVCVFFTGKREIVLRRVACRCPGVDTDGTMRRKKTRRD